MLRQFKCPRQFKMSAIHVFCLTTSDSARLRSLKPKFLGRHWRESQRTPIASLSDSYDFGPCQRSSWVAKWWIIMFLAWAVRRHLCLSFVAMLCQCLASPHLPYQVELTCFQLVSGENNQISRTGPSWCCSGDTCDFEICARIAVETLPLKTVLSCKSW